MSYYYTKADIPTREFGDLEMTINSACSSPFEKVDSMRPVVTWRRLRQRSPSFFRVHLGYPYRQYLQLSQFGQATLLYSQFFTINNQVAMGIMGSVGYLLTEGLKDSAGSPSTTTSPQTGTDTNKSSPLVPSKGKSPEVTSPPATPLQGL